MIEIAGLVKVYDGTTAVNGLSLAVGAHEIVGLVGPNGAGKTTTLRCLAGIIPPTEGRIAVAGFDLAGQPVEARRRFAFVPDEPRLFDSMTVWDHVQVFARLYGVTDAAPRAEELLARFELADRKRSFPAELSRGMKQKLMVTLALLHRPEALILDEPLTGLDPSAMRRMKRTIVEQAAAGTAVLVSSHMLHLVEEICHRIVIVQKGRTLLEGTIGQIRASLPDLGEDANLEDIFLHATEGTGGDAPVGAGGPAGERP